MRGMLAVAIGLVMLTAGPAAALQQTPPAAAPAEAGEDEVVIVRSHVDRALDAFMRGDFVTAEEEFTKNFRCVQRADRLREAAIEQAGYGSSLGFTTPHFYMPLDRPDLRIRERTCERRDWQLYMIGLSQIQLGKFSEARANLDRATQVSPDPYLYDAYFRIGLIDLQNGDVERADRQLARLNRILRSCHNHSVGCEYVADLEASVTYLSAVIAQERRAHH